MVKLPEQADDSVWEESDVADAFAHYLGLDRLSLEELEGLLQGAAERAPVPPGADAGTRFKVLALTLQDVWMAERFGARAVDAAHFARLRSRFFAALRVIGEHGASLEATGLVILDPAQPWIAPILAEALASAPIRMDAEGVPMLVMPGG